MVRRVLCFFGFHQYRTQVFGKVGTHILHERVCSFCNDMPTRDR